MSHKKDDYEYDYNEMMKHWRSWGSWFSWGSPIGLSLGFAVTLLAVGGFLMMLNQIGLI